MALYLHKILWNCTRWTILQDKLSQKMMIWIISRLFWLPQNFLLFESLIPMGPKILECTSRFHWRQHLNSCLSWLPSSKPIHIESKGNAGGWGLRTNKPSWWPCLHHFEFMLPIPNLWRGLQAWKEGQDTCWYGDRFLSFLGISLWFM